MTQFFQSAGLSAMAIALAMPSAAIAQAAAQAVAETDAEAEQGIADIVVTAQRRSENLQNVPIAITALDNEQLVNSGVSDTLTLQTAVTGLSFNTSLGFNGQPRIRGIGTTANGPGIENPVATYVDGVYLASATTTLISLADVAQVAVLKGPQGTLFGRNATGGLVQVTTKTPGQDFKLNMTGTIRNRDGQAGTLYVAGGLAPNLAASIATNFDRLDDGYGINLLTKGATQRHDSFTTRAKLVWDAGDDTNVALSGDYSFYKGSDFSPRNLAFTVIGAPTPGGPFDTNSQIDSLNRSRAGGGSLSIRHDLGSVELMSLTAYRESRATQFYDQDLTPVTLSVFNGVQKDKQFSQELQLLSTGNGPFKWVLGGIYFTGSGTLDLVVSNTPAPIATTAAKQKLSSFAGFAQASYDFGQGTSFTGGLRYTSDDREVSNKITVFIPPTGVTLTPGNYNGVKKTFGKLTWRLSLDHRFSPEFLAYASYNRGFKSGAFVPQAVVATEVKPEVLDAYEVGFKADLFDRTLRLNGSAYYYDYENTQVSVIAAGLLRLLNASGSKYKGFELDATWQPTRNFNINAGVAYVNAKYGAFPNAPRSFPIVPTSPPPVGSPNGGNLVASYDAANPTNPFNNLNVLRCFPSGVVGNGTNICDATGNTPQNTPKVTFNLGADYTVETGMGNVTLAASYYYNDGFFPEADNRIRQASYDLVNASLTWKAADDKYSVRLWGNNLGNTVYAAQLVSAENGDNRIAGPGRSYGVTFGVNF